MVDNEKISEIAEALQGTCQSLATALEYQGLEEHDTPQDMLEELDGLVMLCEVCGWWCEPFEMNDDNICNDCEEDEDDET